MVIIPYPPGKGNRLMPKVMVYLQFSHLSLRATKWRTPGLTIRTLLPPSFTRGVALPKAKTGGAVPPVIARRALPAVAISSFVRAEEPN